MRGSDKTLQAWIAIVLNCGLTLAGTQNANATVVAGPLVNGFDTFRDTSTSRIWLRMDSFFGQTTNQMTAAASVAGFTFATKADVEQLLNSLPLGGGEWLSTYKPIMGDAPNRELIWGSYDDGGDPLRSGEAFAYLGDTSWSFYDGLLLNNFVPNSGTDLADMNIWAYVEDRTSVPEPATLLLLVVGLAGLGGSSLTMYRRG